MLPRYFSEKWKTAAGFYDLPADEWRAENGMLTPVALETLGRRRFLLTLARVTHALINLPLRLLLLPFVMVSQGLELERLHFVPVRRITRGKGCVIDRHTWLVNGHNIRLGNNVKISAFATVMAGTQSTIHIGNNTMVGPSTLICAVNHGHDSVVVPMRLQRWQESEETSVVVGNDVWIGANAVILPGTVIGDGCIIGAGALVAGVIPEKSVYTDVRMPRIRSRDGVETVSNNGLADPGQG